MPWIPCPSCHRHLRADAIGCPFCAAPVSRALAPSVGGFACAVIGLVLCACLDRAVDDDDDSGPSTMDGSSSGESSSGDDDSSTSTTMPPDNSAAAVTYAAPSPNPEELAAEQGTASDTDGDAPGE